MLVIFQASKIKVKYVVIVPVVCNCIQWARFVALCRGLVYHILWNLLSRSLQMHRIKHVTILDTLCWKQYCNVLIWKQDFPSSAIKVNWSILPLTHDLSRQYVLSAWFHAMLTQLGHWVHKLRIGFIPKSHGTVLFILCTNIVNMITNR